MLEPMGMRAQHLHAVGRIGSILVLCTVLGCSATYNGERLFWKAQQRAAVVAKDPEHATAAQLSAAVDAYDRVIREARGTLWAGRAQLAIGSLYALTKDYGRARDSYRLVLQNSSQQQELCVEARVGIGKSYELEQHWDEAVKAYRELFDYHPWTKRGLEAPLYVASGFEKRKQSDQAQRAYERAVKLYTKLIADAPSAEQGAQVRLYLALAYQQLGQWDQAINVLQELAKRPTEANRPLVLLTLGRIYQTKLGNPQKAQEMYQTLLQEFPEHPLGQMARKQLEQLGGHPADAAGAAAQAPAASMAPGQSSAVSP